MGNFESHLISLDLSLFICKMASQMRQVQGCWISDLGLGGPYVECSEVACKLCYFYLFEKRLSF